MTILEEIEQERARQDVQWGGPVHDDSHEDSDWRQYRSGFENRISLDYDAKRKRDALIKIAALAVAQIESLDRLVNS